MIQADNLSKAYRGRVAVDDLSFSVQAGKVTGFLGPNGAGKSTTMRLMLGLDKGKGTTLFDGKPLATYPQPAKVVGILLEAKAYHPTRTARDHLRVLAAAGGIAETRVDEALATVGLTEVANQRPGKFSLGMSQRLGIAAAILGQPKYLILDEPANGLDPEGIAWLRQFLKAYADLGNAVFVSSHLLAEMAQMADRIVVIGKGKLMADTSIEELTAGGEVIIYVRVGKQDGAKLQAACELHELLIQPTGDDSDRRDDSRGWLVKSQAGVVPEGGFSTDVVGRLAFDARIAVLELSQRAVSLEDAFIRLTGVAEEYRAQNLPVTATAVDTPAAKSKGKETHQ